MRTELSIEDSKKIESIVDRFKKVFYGPLEEATPEKYEGIIEDLCNEVEFVAKWWHLMNNSHAHLDNEEYIKEHYPITREGTRLLKPTFESDAWYFANMVHDISQADSLASLVEAAQYIENRVRRLLSWVDEETPVYLF